MVYRGMSNYYKKIPDDYKRMFEDFNIPKEIFFNRSLNRDIDQNIYFYPVYILDNLYCLLLQENLKMIYNQSDKKPLYYIHVYIKNTNRRSGHTCMIIVDTTKKPFRVYILDTVYPKIEASKDIDTLMKYALVPGFEYHGHI